MTSRSRRSLLHATTTRAAIAGAAALATVLGPTAMAMADDEPTDPGATETEATPPAEPTDSTSEPTPSVTPTEGEESESTDDAQDEVDEKAPAEATDKQRAGDDADVSSLAVEPNYGTRKYRVGVRQADGSYLPDGVSTMGSTLTLTTTNLDGTVDTVTCTTSVPAIGGGPNDTNCPGTDFFSYYAPPGATVVVSLTEPAAGIEPTDETLTVTPCDYNTPGSCTDFSGAIAVTGLRPTTVDDEATTKAGTPVVIDVLANDDNIDPTTTELTIAGQPANGTAEVTGAADPGPTASPTPTPTITTTAPPIQMSKVASRKVGSGQTAQAVDGAGSLRIVYTPNPTFTGTDTFTYALANSNGSTTGTVNVTVVGGVVTPDPTDPTPTPTTPTPGATAADSGSLPNAGGAPLGLLATAGALVVAGGGLAAAGRRRPTRG